jgi:hypothetical protein
MVWPYSSKQWPSLQPKVRIRKVVAKSTRGAGSDAYESAPADHPVHRAPVIPANRRSCLALIAESITRLGVIPCALQQAVMPVRLTPDIRLWGRPSAPGSSWKPRSPPPPPASKWLPSRDPESSSPSPAGPACGRGAARSLLQEARHTPMLLRRMPHSSCSKVSVLSLRTEGRIDAGHYSDTHPFAPKQLWMVPTTMSLGHHSALRLAAGVVALKLLVAGVVDGATQAVMLVGRAATGAERCSSAEHAQKPNCPHAFSRFVRTGSLQDRRRGEQQSLPGRCSSTLIFFDL